MIVYREYIYRKDKANSNTMYWRCVKMKCKGRLVSILDYKDKDVEEIQLKVRGHHFHPPDPLELKARKALIEAKSILNCNDLPRNKKVIIPFKHLFYFLVAKIKTFEIYFSFEIVYLFCLYLQNTYFYF